MARTKTLQNDLNSIRDDLAALRSSLANLTAETARAGSAVAKSARRYAKNTAGAGSDVWDNSLALGNDSVAAVQTGFSMIRRQFRESPLRAGLVVLGLGLLIAALRR